MKINRRYIKMLALMIGIVAFAGAFVGCNKGSSKTINEGSSSDLSGTLNLVGSTSVTPLAEELGSAFTKLHPGVKVNVQGVGSTAGIKSVIDSTSEIGMSSRNLNEEEKNMGINEYIIAYDGIVVAVNPNNTVNNLDMETVKKIFKGEITNWKEIGGKDKEILIISREEGSGTRGAFEEIVGLEQKDENGNKLSLIREDALVAEGNGAVKANIANKENAIGYLSLSYLDDTVKGLKINSVDPTVENILSDKYSISRPFLFLTKGEQSELTKEFLNFTLGEEGQAIVSEKQIPVKK